MIPGKYRINQHPDEWGDDDKSMLMFVDLYPLKWAYIGATILTTHYNMPSIHTGRLFVYVTIGDGREHGGMLIPWSKLSPACRCGGIMKKEKAYA